jgi:hypothetical protein
MHTGGKYVELADLRHIPLPDETATYKPVGHYDLAVNLAEVARGLLPDYELVDSRFGLARQGNQMFGIHTYRNGHNDSLGLSIGFRNSYDKSMSVGIAIGASVLVCDNLALTGEITILRKHTANVWEDLEELMITTVYRSRHNFHRIEEDAARMQDTALTDDRAFRLMGLLYGKRVVSIRQLPVVRREWVQPSHEVFMPRNLWSFYNAVTEALKSCPPNLIMEKHIRLHKILMAPEMN